MESRTINLYQFINEIFAINQYYTEYDGYNELNVIIDNSNNNSSSLLNELKANDTIINLTISNITFVGNIDSTFFNKFESLNNVKLEHCTFNECFSLSNMFNNHHELVEIEIIQCNFPQCINVSKTCYNIGSQFKRFIMLQCNFPLLESLTSIICNCSNVKTVIMSYCNFSAVTCFYPFEQSFDIQYIDFSNNNFNSLASMRESLCDLNQLQTIRFENINFQSLNIVYGLFANCDNLREIHFENSQLPKLLNFKHMFSSNSDIEYSNLFRLEQATITNLAYQSLIDE